jgi:hypothetical protein
MVEEVASGMPSPLTSFRHGSRHIPNPDATHRCKSPCTARKGVQVDRGGAVDRSHHAHDLGFDHGILERNAHEHRLR